MATIKSEVQTASSLTVTGLTTLASGNYVVSSAITHSTNDALDVLIDVRANTTSTPTGNKQVVIFCKGSIDGTTFSSGPESGTSNTDEPDLHYVGSLPMNSASVEHRRIYSLAAAYGGVLPAATKIVLKNDLGVALTDGAVNVAEVWGVAV